MTKSRRKNVEKHGNQKILLANLGLKKKNLNTLFVVKLPTLKKFIKEK